MQPLVYVTNYLPYSLASRRAFHLRHSLIQRSLVHLQHWYVQHSLARSRRSLADGARLICMENEHGVYHRHSPFVFGVEMH
jgi:hypothetical protein